MPTPKLIDAVGRFDPRAESFKRISLQQFQFSLRHAVGAKIITVTTLTDPDMRKTGNPFVGKVKKLSRLNGVVNFNYSNAMNNLREKAGEARDFVAEPRKWGTRLAGLPFVSHVLKTGEARLYLEMKVEHNLGREFRYTDSGIALTDAEVETLKPFLTVRAKPELILRDIDVRHILSLYMDGQGYLIDND